MWRKLLEEGAIDWEDISNKPKEYPPTEHPHKEYAESTFFYKEIKYDLHDVVAQIVMFLEETLEFKLKEPE